VTLRHPFAALAAAALAILALAGCQTNAGTAAHVDDRSVPASAIDDSYRTLTQDEVDAYNTQFPSTTGPATVASLARVARSIVVTFSVRETLLEQAWERSGGLPSDGALEALHDRAIVYLFGSSNVPAGSEGDDLVRDQLDWLGVDPDFGATMIRSTELLLAFGDDKDVTSDAELAAAVNATGVEVRLNPRYGSWDTETLSLGPARLPSYLTDPDATPAAA